MYTIYIYIYVYNIYIYIYINFHYTHRLLLVHENMHKQFTVLL